MRRGRKRRRRRGRRKNPKGIMSKNSVKRDVRLQVAPGPLACSFEPDYNGCAAVIKGFSLTPAGLESPLAKRVKRGYVLVAVDDTVLGDLEGAR